MRESRLSGSVEGAMGNHDSYSDSMCRAGTDHADLAASESKGDL